MTEAAARAIVSDDGATIRLALFTVHGGGMAVVLAPVRAVALAGELIRAAILKLGVATNIEPRHGRSE